MTLSTLAVDYSLLAWRKSLLVLTYSRLSSGRRRAAKGGALPD